MNAVLTKHSDAAPTGEASVSLEPIPAVAPSRGKGSILVRSAKQIGTSLVKALFYLIVLFIHTPLHCDVSDRKSITPFHRIGDAYVPRLLLVGGELEARLQHASLDQKQRRSIILLAQKRLVEWCKA